MPLCQSCGDTGPGVYCSACGERREPRARRESREPEASPLHVREALFAHQRAMEEMYGVDDTPQTPDNFAFRNASEMRWCNLRAALQSRMMFDEEWIVDTPRSELLWQATCLQQGIERGVAAAGKDVYANDGPVGFTWWGSPLPQTVEIVDLGADGGNLSRVRVSVRLGTVPDECRDQVLGVMGANRFPVAGSAFMIDDSGQAMLATSIAMDSSMIDEVAHFVGGMLSRQMAKGHIVQQLLAQVEMLGPAVQPHPAEGLRQDGDELVGVLGNAALAAPPDPSRTEPVSPEGVRVPDLFSKAVAVSAADACSMELRADRIWFESADIVLFAPPGMEDPYVYFAYQPAEMSEHVGLLPDPGVLFWLQAGGRVFPSEAEALAAANSALVRLWEDGDRNILGGFRVTEADAGQYILTGPVSFWSAPMLSLALDMRPDVAAELIWHIHLHLLDQSAGLTEFLSR
jgi:hypothetical protein